MARLHQALKQEAIGQWIEGDLASRKADVNKLDAIVEVVLKTLLAPVMPFVSPELEKEAREERPCDKLLFAARTVEAGKKR